MQHSLAEARQTTGMHTCKWWRYKSDMYMYGEPVQLRQEESLDSLSLVQVRRACRTQINQGGIESRARDEMVASHTTLYCEAFEELVRLTRRESPSCRPAAKTPQAAILLESCTTFRESRPVSFLLDDISYDTESCEAFNHVFRLMTCDFL